MRITFWGVRGSIPATGPDFVEYGGNNTFISIDKVSGWGDNEFLTLDFGSGAKDFGAHIMKNGKTDPIEILSVFSHFHWDHISGFPFFTPIYLPDHIIRLFSYDRLALKKSIEMQSNGINFPVSIDDVAARIEYEQILHCQKIYAPTIEQAHSFLKETDQTMQMALKGLVIDSLPLNHPQVCVGYRITELRTNKTFVYITDHEPNKYIDLGLIEFISNSDVIYMDGMYDGSSFENFKGYGHSTWEECVKRFEKAENVKKMLIGHHNYTSTDSQLRSIDKELGKKYKDNCVRLAKDGMVVDLD